MKQNSVTCSHVETSPCSGLKIAMSITIDANCLIKWHQNYLRWRVQPSCVFHVFPKYFSFVSHVFPSCVCHVFPTCFLCFSWLFPMCFSRVSCVSPCFPCVSRVFLMFPKYFPCISCVSQIFSVYLMCFSSIFHVFPPCIFHVSQVFSVFLTCNKCVFHVFLTCICFPSVPRVFPKCSCASHVYRMFPMRCFSRVSYVLPTCFLTICCFLSQRCSIPLELPEGRG